MDAVVQACVCLHNFLVEDKPISQMYAELNPESRPYMRKNGMMRNLPRLPGYRSSNDARTVRNTFKEYFNSTQGTVSWQQRQVSYRIV